jgi:hypothetical protein
MDLYNVIIKNQVADEIKSVKDLEYLGSGTTVMNQDTSFFFFETNYTKPYMIKVNEQDNEYFINGLERDSNMPLPLDLFIQTLNMGGLSKTQLFESMQQIANRTFINDIFKHRIFKGSNFCCRP